MNKVLLTGNLVKDIDISFAENGRAFAKGTIAVRREYKNGNGDYDADFIDFVVFGRDAEYLNDYSSKGCKLEIVGRWQVRNVNKNGENRRYNEVMVESVNAYNKGNKEVEREEEPFTYDDAMNNKNVFDDKDLPF